MKFPTFISIFVSSKEPLGSRAVYSFYLAAAFKRSIFEGLYA